MLLGSFYNRQHISVMRMQGGRLICQLVSHGSPNVQTMTDMCNHSNTLGGPDK